MYVSRKLRTIFAAAVAMCLSVASTVSLAAEDVLLKVASHTEVFKQLESKQVGEPTAYCNIRVEASQSEDFEDQTEKFIALLRHLDSTRQAEVTMRIEYLVNSAESMNHLSKLNRDNLVSNSHERQMLNTFA